MSKRFVLSIGIVIVTLAAFLVSGRQCFAAEGSLNLLWPVQNHTVTQYFISGSHWGIDVKNTQQSTGALIYAAEEGTVIMAGWDNYGGGGKLIKIDHRVIDGIHYYTWYAHLASFMVANGNTVSKGQPIGIMGCTGTCTGTHLHFQFMRDGSTMGSGTPLNPMSYLSGEPSPPHLVLNSDVVVTPNPVVAGGVVKIDFTIKNIGGSELKMDEIFVRCTYPNQAPDGDWKAWAVKPTDTPVDIPAGGSQPFTAKAATWEGEQGTSISYEGTWEIKEIIYYDSNRTDYILDLNGQKPGFKATKPKVKIIAGRTAEVVTSDWTPITFDYELEGSSWHILANLCTEQNRDPSHLDIKGLSSTGVQFRVEEDLASNGAHGAEEVCYVAIAGNATYFENRGRAVFAQPDPNTWYWVDYPQIPSSLQPMAANISTNQGSESVHIDIKHALEGSNLRLEEDLHLDGIHGTKESVDWVVWTDLPPGATKGYAGSVTHEWSEITFGESFTSRPVVIARIVTERGTDCAIEDLAEVYKNSFKVKVEECRPCGDCSHFNGERIDWMAVEPGILEW